MTLRCESITSTGDRCRETRLPWLRLAEDSGRLRCLCASHWEREQPYFPNFVSAKAVYEWLCK